MLKIGKRINKNISPTSWLELSSFRDIHDDKSLPKIISFGGNMTTNSKNANGVNKNILSALHTQNLSNKFKYNINDIAELYSVYYDEKSNRTGAIMNALGSLIYEKNYITGYSDYSEGEEESFYTSPEMTYSEGEENQTITAITQLSQERLRNIIINGFALDEYNKIQNNYYDSIFKNLKDKNIDSLVIEFYQTLQEIKTMTSDIFLPFLQSNGERLDIKDAIKKNNVTFVTHCFGAYIVNFMEENLIDLMRDLNYTESEISELCNSITVTQIAPPIINKKSSFQNYYLGTTNDSVFTDGFTSYESLKNKYFFDSPNIITADLDPEEFYKAHALSTFISEKRESDTLLSQNFSNILVSTIRNLHNRKMGKKEYQANPLTKEKSKEGFRSYIEKKYSQLGLSPLDNDQLSSLFIRDTWISDCNELIISINDLIDKIIKNSTELEKISKCVSTIKSPENTIRNSNKIDNAILSQKENEAEEEYVSRLKDYDSRLDSLYSDYRKIDTDLINSINKFYVDADVPTIHQFFSQQENLTELYTFAIANRIPFSKVLSFIDYDNSIFKNNKCDYYLVNLPSLIKTQEECDEFKQFIERQDNAVPEAFAYYYKTTIESEKFLKNLKTENSQSQA